MDPLKWIEDLKEYLDNPLVFLGVLIFGVPVASSRLTWFYGGANTLVQNYGVKPILAILIVAVIILYVLFLSLYLRVKSIEGEDNG